MRVGNEPDLAWKLQEGDWERIEEPLWECFNGLEFPSEGDLMAKFAASLAGGRNEWTWTPSQIKTMWGTKIRDAAFLASESIEG